MKEIKRQINQEPMNNKYSISQLPQSIIESDIFSYLNSKDLFYSVRGVCSEWQEIMKNMWTDNIKSEMIDQVKSLDFLYEKEIFTKTYEFKLNYLINYKQLLTIYSTQTNILSILKMYTNKLDLIDFRKFFKLFFSFIGMEFGYDCVIKYEDIYNSSNDENSKNTILKDLNDFLDTDTSYSNFRHKIFVFLDFESCLKDTETLSNFKQYLTEINRENFENSEENTKLLYTFLQGLIEFQSLKSEVKELRKKIELLISRIKEETQVWPKRKNFFEKAYKLIIFSKSVNEGVRKMIDIFESNKIRHPIVDFNDQALHMIYDLKCKLTKFYDYDGFGDDHSDMNGPKTIEEIIFNNILARRVLLTEKILIMDKFYQIYIESKTDNENEFKLEENEIINLKQLLWCMKFSSNSENENVSIQSILKTKAYLDDHFDYDNNIIFDCSKKRENKQNAIEFIDPEIEADLSELDKDLEVTFKQSEISLKEENIEENNLNKEKKIIQRYTEEDLTRLRKEKQILEDQKSKTENVLEMLKKFVALKKNLTSNKKKYKLALYLLSNIRQGDTFVFNRIDDLDIDNIEFNENIPISDTEREELDNFMDSDKLMKEIEEGIMAQIENIMKKENEGSEFINQDKI